MSSSGLKKPLNDIPKTMVEQLHQRLSEIGIYPSLSTLFNVLSRLRIALKNYHELDRINSATTFPGRQVYALDFSLRSLNDKQTYIFIDESEFHLHMRRTLAGSRAGTRANVVLPTVRSRMVTLISALYNQVLVHSKIISDCTCNGANFSTFVGELVQRIRCRLEMHGGWPTMANTKMHIPVDLRRILCSSYLLKFLSPYSYILNPVEHLFSKVIASARRLFANPTPNQMVIQESNGTVTKLDCMNSVLNMTLGLTKASHGQPFIN
ncbi:unnamed protein product [Dicrocoelium dendriticum]|nr:unnamed protein product [Dicrocoelium dendriticum]